MGKKSKEQKSTSKIILILYNNLKTPPNSCVNVNICVYKIKSIENISVKKGYAILRYIFTRTKA